MPTTVTITRTWTVELEDGETLYDLTSKSHIPSRERNATSETSSAFQLVRDRDFGRLKDRVKDLGTTVRTSTTAGHDSAVHDPTAAVNQP